VVEVEEREVVKKNKKENKEEIMERVSLLNDLIKNFKKQLNIEEKRVNYVWKKNMKRKRSEILFGYEESCTDNNDDSLGSEKLNVVGKKFKRNDEGLNREIEALSRLRGKPGILMPIDIYEKGRKVILVFPKLYKFNPSNEHEIFKGYKKVKEILETIHKENIIHHDIKPSHIMTDREGNIYVIDFDICRLPNEDCDHSKFVPGTEGFKAPTTILCNKEIDYFSLDEVKKFWYSNL